MDKIDTYSEAMNNTPKNVGIQKLLDEMNLLLPYYVKVYGFQCPRNPKTVTVIALAFEGCPKHLIGGDKFSDSVGSGTYTENLPKGAISNYLGMGINGEVAGGCMYLEDELRHEISKLKEVNRHCEKCDGMGWLSGGYYGLCKVCFGTGKEAE